MAVPTQLDDLTTAVLLLVLIEIRSYLARKGVAPRREGDHDQ